MDDSSLVVVLVPNTLWKVVVPFSVASSMHLYDFIEPLRIWVPDSSRPRDTKLTAARRRQTHISYGQLVLRPAGFERATLKTVSLWSKFSPIEPPPCYQNAKGQAALMKMIGWPYKIVLLMGGFYDVLSKHPQMTSRYPALAKPENQHLIGQIFGRRILDNRTELETVDCVLVDRVGNTLSSLSDLRQAPSFEYVREVGQCLTHQIALDLSSKAVGSYHKTNKNIMGVVVRGGQSGYDEVLVLNDHFLLDIDKQQLF